MIPDRAERFTYHTSFVRLFSESVYDKTIRQIRIPMIQRDYAQGRENDTVNRIRERFLGVLCRALEDESSPVDLDFVYGDITQDHVLLPLDGQQRLTTLFLLHWYVAQRAGIDIPQEPWIQFSYDTRPSARQFCEFLVRTAPDWPSMRTTLSAWLEDQAEYFVTWRHDPTIQSMLVMLDGIHRKLGSGEQRFKAAWSRLASPTDPAIRFHLLPMEENGLTDSLYIKMNSRGKPLTEFETFKADFEGMLKRTHPDHASRFAKRADNEWTDILWEYRGDTHLIDEEFMRYFRFVTDMYAWKEGKAGMDRPIDEVAAELYGVAEPGPIDYLLDSFDVWRKPGVDVRQEGHVRNIFGDLFATESDGAGHSRIVLFSLPGERNTVDLFHACCKNYGEGPKRWTTGHSLLLYALLVCRIEVKQLDLGAIRKRLRVVRNLVEASDDELALRESNARIRMQNLLRDVGTVMSTGEVSQLNSLGFNQAQVKDEIRKLDFEELYPHLTPLLHKLEDHGLLRGGLTAFSLDPSFFERRATTFLALFDKIHWHALTGALLTKGDYGRRWNRGMGTHVYFGSGKNSQPWLELFRGRQKEERHPMADALVALLDDVAERSGELSARLDAICADFLNAPETPKNWIYYFVKYPEMREAPQGGYAFGESRFRACRLHGKYVHSFQDPYLMAVVNAAGLSGIPGNFDEAWQKFYGVQDETGPRPLTLARSRIALECVQIGWAVRIPPEFPIDRLPELNKVLARHNVNRDDGVLVVAGSDAAGGDRVDRIEAGARLLNDLVRLDVRADPMMTSAPGSLSQ